MAYDSNSSKNIQHKSTGAIIDQENSSILIQEGLSTYSKEGTAENTRIAYQADIQYYQEQGGQLPATLDSIISFLEASASLRNPRSLRRIS